MRPPPNQRAAASPGRRGLLIVALTAALLGLGITLSFGYADHDPRPHHVRLAVAAPAALRTQLTAGLDRAAPDGFEIVAVPNARDVTQSVRGQSTAGGFIVRSSQAVVIVTASADGLLQQQAITAALTAAAQSMHRPAEAVDVAPLSSNDRAGLSAFTFELGLLIPSVIGGVGLFLLGMRLRLWWRVAAATLFGLLCACGGVLAIDSALGGLTGAGAALVGLGFLGALSFVLFVAAVQAVIGLPGTGLAAVAFIFVGNAVSGGTVPIAFLPGGFRQIAPWLPNDAIVQAARDVVYFHGHDLAHSVLVLCLWPAGALAVLLGVDLIHLSERRQRPHHAHEIYRTSALAHLTRRFRERRGDEPSRAGIA